MNDKQLVSKIQGLKQIKPNQQWVFFTKQQVFNDSINNANTAEVKPGILDIIKFITTPKRFVYSTLTVCLAVVFVFTMINYASDIERNNKIQYAALIKGADFSNQNLEMANKKIEDLIALASLKKNNVTPSDVKDANQIIAAASRTITEEIVDNPGALKKITDTIIKIDASKKTLAALGVKIDEDFQLNNIIQPLVEKQIKELEKSTLSEDQELTLKEIKGLYDEGQYSDALEKLLLINSK